MSFCLISNCIIIFFHKLLDNDWSLAQSGKSMILFTKSKVTHIIVIPCPERLNERLDFTLREGMTDVSYISSITSHLSYWTSTDCAQFLLLQIYSYKHSSAH